MPSPCGPDPGRRMRPGERGCRAGDPPAGRRCARRAPGRRSCPPFPWHWAGRPARPGGARVAAHGHDAARAKEPPAADEDVPDGPHQLVEAHRRQVGGIGGVGAVVLGDSLAGMSPDLSVDRGTVRRRGHHQGHQFPKRGVDDGRDAPTIPDRHFPVSRSPSGLAWARLAAAISAQRTS